MGRFFLLILILQTVGKVNMLIQEVFYEDLSLPFYEIEHKIPQEQRSFETRFCQFSGALAIFAGFLSQFYCLWLAVLIKQILKDPIHRLNKFMYCYHFVTISVSVILTLLISTVNNFGVEV
jgi:hypothetical protein